MTIEHRSLITEVRAPDGDGRTFEAVVMRYGVVDDYDTIFDPGCFTASLEKRLPRITRSHDWNQVIGRVVDYRDTPETLTIVGELDDFDAVPLARATYAQLQSGSLDEFSVGFRRGAVSEDEDGRTHFTRATLDEVAVVLAGAVPDTQLVGVRTLRVPILGQTREVPESLVIDLAKQVADGTLSKEAAQVAIDLAAGSGVDAGSEGAGGETTPPDAAAGPTIPDEVLDLADELIGG